MNTTVSRLCVLHRTSLPTRAPTSLLQEGLNRRRHIPLLKAAQIHTGAWNLQEAQDQLTCTEVRAILLPHQEAIHLRIAEAHIRAAADPTAADHPTAEADLLPDHHTAEVPAEVLLTVVEVHPPPAHQAVQDHLHQADLQAGDNAFNLLTQR